MSTVRIVAVAALLAASIAAQAKGGSHHGGAIGPGTGSNYSSNHVNGYVKKDGTYVAPHERSTSDKKFDNNWSTKGNDNPTTGKDGTRVTEPNKN